MRTFYQNFRRMLLVGFFLSTGICLYAQVTIGDETPPKEFSVLELSTTNVKGGLRLPHLTTLQRDGLNASLTATAQAPGLMIYNIDTNCMEYWDGTKWISQCYDENIKNITEGTGTFTGKTTFDIAYSNNGINGCGPTNARERIKSDFGNRTPQDPTLPAYVAPFSGIQVYTFKPAGEVSKVRFLYRDITGRVIEKITPNVDYSEMTNITGDCKVTVDFNESLDRDLRGLSFQTALGAELYVIYNDNGVGTGVDRKLQLNLILMDCACGAATNSGGWLNFMCHNLGADVTLDPFSYVVGRADGSRGTLGWLYQWGRPTDEHQKRNSPITSTLASNNDATLPLDVKGKFILTSIAPHDWRSGGGNNTRWGNGTTQANQAKAANDPCPAGWKVPSQLQWSSIFRGGTTSGAPNTATANTWQWTNSGFKVGSALYLPATGIRDNALASVANAGSYGYYWSTTPIATDAYSLNFNSGNVAPAELSNRAKGLSVRCVEENPL